METPLLKPPGLLLGGSFPIMLSMLAFFLLTLLMVLVIVGVMYWFFFLRGR